MLDMEKTLCHFKPSRPLTASTLYLKGIWNCLIGLCLASPIWAQKNVSAHPNAIDIARNYIIQQQKTWDLTEEDVRHVVVVKNLVTEDNGLSHVHVFQAHQGVILYNGVITVTVLPSGEVLYAANRFVKNLAGIVNTAMPALSPEKAIADAMSQLDMSLKHPLSIKEKRADGVLVFDKGSSTLTDMTVQLVYQYVNARSVRLAYDILLDHLDGHHMWSVRIDAVTGKILEKNNLTISCSFNHNAYQRGLLGTEEEHVHSADCQTDTPLSIEGVKGVVTDAVHVKSAIDDIVAPPPTLASSYRVFALPLESPKEGAQAMAVNPADTLTSPYGWHDTNGVMGAEYQITRGNNVHAYADVAQNGTSVGDEPNGGANLVFSFPYSATAEPDSNKNAAVVNLFYMNNMMHDLSARYGFTESAANFQTKNYTNIGLGNDAVRAEAMDGKDARNDAVRCPVNLGACTNNANFATPPDGAAPRMQMYVWTQPGGANSVTILSPNSIAGTLQTASADAGFGAAITSTPVTGETITVSDGTTSPTLGCNPIVNNLTGKIALVDRGTCEFGVKALNAQRKGAIGVIICNVDEATNFTMLAGAVGNQVTIPVTMIKRSDCDRIRLAMNTGAVRLSLVNPNAASGPTLVDGDFDNGIIAHEYGHGISNRLAGRGNSGCLANGEQQSGEGWSDFLALAFTVKAGDTGTKRRTVGSFAQRRQSGIRTYAYSTDISVNPLTYDNMIYNPEAHGVGEIWTAALWDFYWAMAERYGFDPNLRNVSSGNGRAIKLVLDALKIQPCNPSFLECRDALLAADRAANAGEHQCMIWDIFARRGMGFNAMAGTKELKNDNTEGFEKFPLCVKQLKISKNATPLIKPGDPVEVSIRVINHKGIAATGVTVVDELPVGLTYIANSANRPVTQAAGSLSFTIGNMNHGDTITITYRANSDPARRSVAQFVEDFERNDSRWDIETNTPNAGNIWEISDVFAKSGTKSYACGYPSSANRSDQIATTKNAMTVAGSKPVLRFWHRYDTEPGFDGGIVQVSNNNGLSWQDLGSRLFKNPYRGRIDYGTFVAGNQGAWWGKTNNWIDSYADLSSFAGQSIKIRLRFGTDSLDQALGWFVDDVTVMDMFNYNGRARLTSAQGDTASAEAAARGTIVDPTVFTHTKELKEGLRMKVFPNPASDVLSINIVGEESLQTTISITATDGRQMWSSIQALSAGQETLTPVSIANYPAGIYFVKVSTEKTTLIEKVVKY
jgi:uncharacterized repeat protein (TIGR01451 family)